MWPGIVDFLPIALGSAKRVSICRQSFFCCRLKMAVVFSCFSEVIYTYMYSGGKLEFKTG